MEIKNYEEFNQQKIDKIINQQMKDIVNKEKKAKEILDKVKKEGDKAIELFTEKYDNVELNSNEFKVKESEIYEAYEEVNEETISALERATENIAVFHSNYLPEDLQLSSFGEGRRLGYKFTSIESVGCYVPGGKASYPSSVLMTVIPAKIAGVNQVAVTSPPNKKGKLNPHTLVACDILGVDEIYKIGGVQAIAALAYGTETINKKQKIVGPGGAYVAAAKKLIQKETEIDMVAGPSEIMILSDKTADVESLAWDILAQAEHGPDSISILLTTSKKKAKKVKQKIKKLKDKTDRKELINKSLNRSLIIFGDKKNLFRLCNEIAPEHLEVITESPLEDLSKIKNAGAIFLGEYSPVAAGDYATGCNHVLPTAGLAKIRSGLSVDDFMKKSSVQYLSKKGLSNIRDIAEKIAEIENLVSHKKSIETRFREENSDG